MGQRLFLIFMLPLTVLFSCFQKPAQEIYIGRLEADKTVISAQTAGELREMILKEGDPVLEGQPLARIDTAALEIQHRQQLTRIEGLEAQKRALSLQKEQAESRLTLSRETLEKTERLLLQGGATEQTRDELAVQVDVGRADLLILQARYDLIQFQEEELWAGLDLIELSIEKSSPQSPLSGTVLNRYHNRGELVGVGTPLYELADLSVLDGYIYLPLRSLSRVKIGQSVQVRVSGRDELLPGRVVWIASEGEFTPKTILTEETRDSLVYEVKIRVDNDSGELKIGMPVDVSF
ncbi:MAG: HlyD family efflux transporter periplasmic adaptor subunit [Spirochaetales bacterium]|nr:HlyD family efflux transporter periplasmic adaptor subunit [Spirochaetales bacterium]